MEIEKYSSSVRINDALILQTVFVIKDRIILDNGKT